MGEKKEKCFVESFANYEVLNKCELLLFLPSHKQRGADIYLYTATYM